MILPVCDSPRKPLLGLPLRLRGLVFFAFLPSTLALFEFLELLEVWDLTFVKGCEGGRDFGIETGDEGCGSTEVLVVVYGLQRDVGQSQVGVSDTMAGRTLNV